MLTIEIDNDNLTEKVIERAASSGKSVKDFLQDIISEFVEEKAEAVLPFDIPKLDYRKYVRKYDPEMTANELEIADDPSVKPFSTVTDTVEYARKLRKESWAIK